MTLERRLIVEEPNFSNEANNVLDNFFPNVSKSNPVFNVKATVTLNIENAKDYTFENIHVQMINDVQSSVIETACFAADMWLEDILTSDDYENTNATDLLGVFVSFEYEGKQSERLFVELDLKSKAVAVG